MEFRECIDGSGVGCRYTYEGAQFDSDIFTFAYVSFMLQSSFV